MLKIAIVDDDIGFQNQAKEYIIRYFQQEAQPFSIQCYDDGVKFLSDFHCNFDIVIIDIMMPHMNGIDVARRIRLQDKNVLVVFITITPAFAIRGYEVSAIDYILKPLNYEGDFRFKFDRVVKKALAERQHTKELVLKDEEGRYIRLSVDSLIYIDKDRDNVVFHTKEKTFSHRAPIYKVREALDETNSFVAINSGCLANMAYIANIDGNDVEMLNGDKLVLSRSKRKDFFEKYFTFVDY